MIRPIAEPPAGIRAMGHDDLPMVSDIERRSYEFPWSHGVFRDCLLAGYHCLVLERNGSVAGYGILSIAAGERTVTDAVEESLAAAEAHADLGAFLARM